MKKREDGFVLVLVLSLILVTAVVLASYVMVTRIELKTNRLSTTANSGFYASEAIMNARAEALRQRFLGYQTPAGTTTTNNCASGNIGSGDYTCLNTALNDHNAISYVSEGATANISIPSGQNFAGLKAIETLYTVTGKSLNKTGNPDASTEIVFRSRLVPLFQFAAFFNKDMEYSNTATLSLTGPVHANGNIFLDAGGSSTLSISGQITASGTIYRGKKDANNCGGTVNVQVDPSMGTTQPTMACSGGRASFTQAQLNTTWGGAIKQNISPLQVPPISSLQPQAGALYWDSADLRLVLKQAISGTWGVEVQNGGGTIDASKTAIIAGCSSVASADTAFQDNREMRYWINNSQPTRYKKVLLDVNVNNLLNCIRANQVALGITALNSPGVSKGSQGYVLYFTVKDNSASNISQGGTPTSPVINNYGIKLKNGSNLRGSSASRADLGVSFVSDQAIYIQGNFNNASPWTSAAVIGDTTTILSNNWDTPATCVSQNDGSTTNYYWNGSTWQTASVQISGDQKSSAPLYCRQATNTTVNAAVMAGTAITGGAGGEGQLDVNPQSGGVHNMLRYLEDWGANGSAFTQATINYTGSLVSLNAPLHSAGPFLVGSYYYSGSSCGTDTSCAGYWASSINTAGQLSQGRLAIYTPPTRNYAFDTQFQNASNLPPLSPRFVYLVQDNFTRQYDQ